MKKSKKTLRGLAFVSAILTFFSGCSPFSAFSNREPCIYGGPDMYTSDSSNSSASYKPEENIPDEVYGPPEWFDDNYEDENSEDDAEYHADKNIEAPMYGGPDVYEQEEQ